MARLRYPLLQLLLMTQAVAIINTENLDSSWQRCGIIQYCIVHNDCFEGNEADGWIVFKNAGNYSHPKRPPNWDSNCGRYIIITFLPAEYLGDKRFKIRMHDKSTKKENGMTIFFGKYRNLRPRIECINNEPKIHHTDFILDNDHITGADKKSDPKVTCLIEVATSNTEVKDMRIKLMDLATVDKVSSIEISSEPDGTKLFPVASIVLSNIKNLCKGKHVNALKDPTAGQDEFQPDPAIKLLIPNPKYIVVGGYSYGSDIGTEVFEDDDRVQCPADYPMQRYAAGEGSNGEWEPVKKGLVCYLGQLVHYDDKSKVVGKNDRIKCARKKCGVCEPPPSVRQSKDAPSDTAPLYEPAVDGDKCRTIQCNSDVMVLKAQDRTDFTILKRIGNDPTISVTCAARDDREEKKWDVLYVGPSRLVDAKCAKEVKCTQLHPLIRGNCTEVVGPRKLVKVIENCVPPDIVDNYITPRKVCPKDYDILYVAPGTKNKIRLRTDDFECNKNTGAWTVMTKNNNKTSIPDHSTVHCVMETLTTSPAPVESPFTGSAPFFVLMGGLALCIVAAIIVGAFLIRRTKKRKEARKKAMTEVSITVKQKKKKEKERSDRKEKERKQRQVSVINSTTGDTNSGPNSQSGSIGTPIAPPSKLLTPSQGIYKPDKGCAVLDLTTGQSKNLRWTNHTGDGPPTKRESWAAESNAVNASDSNQDDPQSAIKFAPGEIEAARVGQKKRKERSRQDSNEYKLGDPRPLQTDDAKRANRQVAENLNESDTMK